ncbi:acetyltransferase [Vibrio cholerae]|nr:acetyltransferase [Vibrio cholerae]TQQ01375.1 acetyltransferase [Vibrio cholerae]
MQLLCLSLVVMRCQPLRRALTFLSKLYEYTSSRNSITLGFVSFLRVRFNRDFKKH